MVLPAGGGQTGREPGMAKPFPGWNVCEIPKLIPLSTSKPAPQGGLEPHIALPKPHQRLGRGLESLKVPVGLAKKMPEGRKVVRDVEGML